MWLGIELSLPRANLVFTLVALQTFGPGWPARLACKYTRVIWLAYLSQRRKTADHTVRAFLQTCRRLAQAIAAPGNVPCRTACLVNRRDTLHGWWRSRHLPKRRLHPWSIPSAACAHRERAGHRWSSSFIAAGHPSNDLIRLRQPYCCTRRVCI